MPKYIEKNNCKLKYSTYFGPSKMMPAPAGEPVVWTEKALKKALKKLLREDTVELWSKPYTDEVRHIRKYTQSQIQIYK